MTGRLQFLYKIQPTRPAMLSEGSTDQEAAQALVAGDPAVRQGVMRAELFPYRVALTA